MVTLKMRLPIDKDRRKEFIETALYLLEPIRSEGGCIDFKLCEDLADDGCLLLEQEWLDESALSSHVHGGRFRSLLVAMDLLNGPPEISVSRVNDLQVVETIQELYDMTNRRNGRKGSWTIS
jgi:quinol monooxygenase YgiN